MRAVAIVGGRPTLVDRPIPVPGPHDALVRVVRAGICGTDLHMPHRPEAEGLIPGHEVAGVVESLGEQVTTLAAGTAVAVLPSARCGQCRPCTRGEEQLCERQWENALGFGRDGGYAEYVAVPASSCFPIPAGMAFEQAALVEPFSVALHGVNLADPTPPDSAVVIGAGPVGLLVVAALVERGLTDITVAEPSWERGDVAVSLGASKVVTDARHLPNGDSSACAAVFECSGAAGQVQEAVRLVRLGGTVVVLGVPAEGTTIDLVPRPWTRKEVTLQPSVWYTLADFRHAITSVAAGVLPQSVLKVSTHSLNAVESLFDQLPHGHLVKAQLDPSAT